MFLVPRKRVWTQQPQSLTGIDWGNPMTAGLLVAATPLSAVGGTNYVTPWGLATRGAKLMGPVASTVQNSTIFIIDVGIGVNNSSFWQAPNVVYADTANAYPKDTGVSVRSVTTYGRIKISARDTGGTIRDCSVDVSPDGDFPGYLARAATIGPDLLMTAWGNGEKYGTSGGFQGRSFNPIKSTDAAAIFGTAESSPYDTSTAQTLVLRWQRVLSDEELRSVFSNPWQIFKAPDSRIFVPVSAGGVTNESLTADSITTPPATVGSPLLTQNNALTGSAITASSTLSAPPLTQNHSITGVVISTAAATLSTPALSSAASNYALTATAISTAAATLSAPALAQNHIITASGITTSQPTLSAPTISGDAYNLTAAGIATAAPTLSQPNLAQNHALTGGAIAAGSPVFSTPTLAQQHALLAMGITTDSPTLSTPVLSDGSLPTYTSAPHGRGYRRDMADTIRPKQRNTTRP